MELLELEKLKVFILFFMPGFISIKAYQLLVPDEYRASAEKAIEAVTYSCINYALLYFPIQFVENSLLSSIHPFLYALFYISVLFLFPVIWVLLFLWLRHREFFQRRMPHPTAKPWDYVFSQKKWHWVIVTLKSGEKIGGKYGGKSFTSSNPAPEQIYLEETWVLSEKDTFVRPRKQSEGILILSDEIKTVELFKYIH